MDDEDRSLETLLRATRYLGVAPYRSLRLSQISRPFTLYGRILFLFYGGVILSIVMSDTDTNTRYLATWEVVVEWTYNITGAACAAGILYLGMFHSPRRMRRTFEYWNRVKKITQSIGRMPSADPGQRQVSVLLAVVQLTLFVLNLLDIYSLSKKPVPNKFRIIFAVTIVKFLFFITNIIMAYFVVVAMKISSPLRVINEQLEEICSEMQSNEKGFSSTELNIPIAKINHTIDMLGQFNVRNTDKKLVVEKIRSLARAYVATCELVQQHNSSEEMLLLWLLVYILVNLANSAYLILDKGFYNQDLSKLAIEAIWYVLHITRGMLIASPWHKIDDEVNRTRNFICKLMSNVRCSHDPVLDELEVFHIHLTANRPTYTTLGMVTMKRPLILTMMALVTTGLALME